MPPVLKLVLAISVIVAGVAIPVRYWPAYGVLGCLVFAGHSIAGIPLGYLIKRLLIFLPFVGSMAISLPLSQGLDRGWDLMLQIMFRGCLAFLVSLWLVNVMPFEQLLVTLRKLRVPAVVVAILAFMYRYVFVVWD
ncbi:MAG: cobalt/nickel transport system permease protein, partial [Planctomycetaceae bacterium]